MSTSKLNSINNYNSNESPYKIFSSEGNYNTDINPYSKSSKNSQNYLPKIKDKNKLNYSSTTRPFSSETKDDREVSSISKKLKSMTLSNSLYTSYINFYCNITQDYTFKKPRITNYPLRKNEKYLPIKSQQNSIISPSIKGNQDSIFMNLIKDTDSNSKKEIEKKSYGFKYGKTKIRIRPKSAFATINPKDFQNLCETNIFESELLNQIGLKNIDIYNNIEEKNKNFKYFNNYLEEFNNININNIFNNNNYYKSISFEAKTAIIKKTINFKLDIYTLCLKFYLLGNKAKPQKLFFPFKLLPLFYLLDFQIFKLFLSEIIFYDNKNNCFSFIQNDLLVKKIQIYYNFVSNTIKNDPKYLNFITYNKKELCFYLIYDWVVSNKDNFNCYKLKINLPKIKFYIDEYKIKIIKHLNKHIVANLIKNNFSNWEKFILFDLFCNKRFKRITNLIMVNKQNSIKSNKIFLNKDPNKDPIHNKKYEFYLTESGKYFSNFYIFMPYIILALYGKKKNKYKKIILTWKESKNILKFGQYWGIINTLLKCMFIDSRTNEIFFKLDLLDNIENSLYKIIIQENPNIRLSLAISNKNRNIHNMLTGSKNSSKTNMISTKEREKDKTKTKYKANNFEISLLECSFKKLNITENGIETKYYKIPKLFHDSIYKLKYEKDLFNKNFDDISILGKVIGECSEDIINALEENIQNEELLMKKKAKDPSFNKSVVKSTEKIVNERLNVNKSKINTNFNKLKSFKITSKISHSFMKARMEDKKDINKKPSITIGMNPIEEKPVPKRKFEIHHSQKFNIRYSTEFNAFRGTQRKVSITNVNELNKDRIGA